MDGTIQAYVLDMAADTKKEPLRVKQYDTNSRQARITLKMGGEPWTIPFGAQIYINVRKTDGTLADATCTREDEHTVLAPITEQMTAVTGTQLGELYFLGSDGDIKSQSFPVVVYEAVMDQARMESSDDFQSLQDALRQVQTSTDAADIAAQYATEQGDQARDAAQRANDAADSIQVAVDAAANAKACESNAKNSELAAAQTQQEVTDYVEAQKAAFAGYSKRETDSKYANALTATTTGEGGITVEDAWTAPVLGLDVVGKSEQVVTTGAQLLPQPQFNDTKNGITVKTQTDGGISITGTATAAITFTVAEILLHAGKYTLSGLSGLVVGRMYFQLVEISAQGGQFVAELAKVGHVTSATVTIDHDVWARAEIKVLSGVTAESVCYPMLNFGDTALPWEPYSGGAPSPSPDYPQDIISVGTVSTGAQLLNADTIVQGGINADTGATNNASNFVRSDYIPVKPGDYVLSGDGLKSYLNYVMYFNQEKVIQSSLSIKPTNGKFTVTEGIAYIRIRFIAKDGAEGTVIPSEVVALKPMLNTGDIALPWEPYTGGKPSPSVEYPQTIDIQCSVGNRNLLKKSGNTITTNSYLVKQYYFGDIKPLDGEMYTIQIKGDLGAGKSRFGIFNSGGNVFETSLYTNDIESNGIFKKSFMWINEYGGYTAKNTYISIYATPDSVDVKSTIEWIKLEKGELATPWVPAPEDITPENAEQYSDIIHAAPITLTEPLRGIGEYRDRIACKDGEWGIERYIGVVDNGQWRKLNVASGSAGHRFVYDATDMIEKLNCMVICSKYTRRPKGASFNAIGDYVATDEVGKIFIRTLNPDFETIEAFREFIADAITLYPLAVPTWTPLPSATQQALNALTTYAGTTHLTITAGGPAPTVTLDYVKDTHKALEQCQEAAKEYTDNQIATIVAALPTATQAAIVDNQTTKLLQEVCDYE
nr:MAG TPA: BppU domain protein [Caudoviricetes sp.]